MDRCRYTHTASRYPDRGALSCWRPTYEGNDRCIWHVDRVSKSPDALEGERPQSDERLDGAVLRGISIRERELLEGTILIGATFEKANLEGISLQDADLRAASFDDAHAEGTNFDSTNLEDASFDSTKLQGASFRDAQLKDAEFSGSRIDHDTHFDEEVIYEEKFAETENADERKEYFDAATWVYRQIQSLARRNALFQYAEGYYYREKDLRRRFAWRRGDYLHALRAEGSRWIMGYGRDPWRILATSAVVIVLCALLFPFLGGLQDTVPDDPVTYSLAVPPGSSVDYAVTAFGKSLYFSVVTFATLGYGDIQPVGTAARALSGIETLVGFGLVALLISILLRRGNWL